MAPEQRQAILAAEIRRFAGQGFRVVSQTETSAQLVRPKTFNLILALLGLLFLVVGLFVYLLYYASKRDELLYLAVAEDGTVTRSGIVPAEMMPARVCGHCGKNLSSYWRTKCGHCGASFVEYPPPEVEPPVSARH